MAPVVRVEAGAPARGAAETVAPAYAQAAAIESRYPGASPDAAAVDWTGCSAGNG